MKVNHPWLKQITRLGFLLAMGVSMGADAGLFGLGGDSWKEEVLLHDGQKIIVKRSQTYGGYSEPASRERSLAEEEWVFQIPGTNQNVIWRSNFQRPPEGDGLMLLLLDFLHGIPYVATSPAGCLAYNYWGRPNPPYVFLKFDGKAWQRISLSEFPAVFNESNVAVGRPDTNHRQGLLSVEAIKEENRLLEPYLRHLNREPLKPGAIGVSCPELVRIKGGWGSPGGAKSPIPISPHRQSDKK